MDTQPTRQPNPRQHTFARLYALYGDAGRAYLESGYKVTDKAIASVNGVRLLRNARIRELVSQHELELQDKRERAITAEWLEQRVIAEAETGDTTAGRVSALRLAADIKGLSGGGRADVPVALSELMEAIGRGLSAGLSRQSDLPALEVSGEVTDSEE